MHTESVCIIDDDHIYINLVSRIIQLKKLSNRVLVFNNGKEALEYFETSLNKTKERLMPKVIFLDLNMPIMDGWEFLKLFPKVKQQINKSIQLYVVSSSINKVDIQRAKSISIVSDYISKPLSIGDFEKILS